MARKILLADDSVTAQNMGRKILTDAGYDVVTVNNGSAALKRVGEQRPDLIVLDVYMPGYSGLEVCARLKDAPDTSRIPILLTVGKLEPFKPEEASRVRADAFIVKPFEASELLSALTRLEDRMVPQADGSRFSTSVSGIERFSSGDPAMRQADPEETGWRNRLRFPSKKKKEEPEPEEDFGTTPFRDFKNGKSKAPARGSFAVNSAPAPGQEPGLVPDIPRDITPEELDALSDLVAKLDGPIPAAENVAPLGEQLATVDTPVAKADENRSEANRADQGKEAAVQAAEAPASAAEATSEIETPPVTAAVTETPASTSTSEIESATAVAPRDSAEDVPAQPEQTVAQATPDTAPRENSFEPVVAAAPGVSETAKIETSELTPATSVEPIVAAEPPAAAEPAIETEAVAQAEAPVANALSKLDASTPAVEEPATPAPSAEDLAEALRLLTPSQGGQTLAEAGAALAQELARDSSPGTRWVAENVALTQEEASLSLEAEMFKSFASGPAVPAADANPEVTNLSVRHEQEEAAEAAVEAAETVTPSESAPAAAEVVQVQAAETAMEYVKDSRVNAGEEAGKEEVAAVTFADAIRNDESVEVASAESVSSGGESGGSEDMAKDAKGKGKWHQIHATPELAAKTDVVETAKQTDDSPKTMAAAASSEGASDPNAIASIVDSVLADLKPKIVEEIAKKLAKK